MTQIFQTRVVEIEDFPAAGLRRLRLAAAPGVALPAYHAGQYAMLTFADCAPRPYSIGNAPGNATMEFHIRQSGSGASHYATTRLHVGDTVEVAAPYGDCLYVRDCERPLIAVAGGSGLAGMKAIIEEALADEIRDAPVTLYYGARRRDDLYMDDEFRRLEDADKRFRYCPILSEERHDNIRHGLVSTAMTQDTPDLSGYRIYGAGPVEMLRHLEQEALAHGGQAEYLHTDLHQHSEFQKTEFQP